MMDGSSLPRMSGHWPSCGRQESMVVNNKKGHQGCCLANVIFNIIKVLGTFERDPINFRGAGNRIENMARILNDHMDVYRVKIS